MTSTSIEGDESTMESLQFLLDTNIVSQLVRHPQGIIRDRIAEVGEQTVCVSLLVAAELRFGTAKKQSARLAQQVEAVLSALPILPLDTPVDAHYAEIRVGLETSGCLSVLTI
jgi:tRNA(fMet)-specific endonuclease VapC